MPLKFELRTPDGVLLAWLQERPSWCERGRYHALVDVPHYVSANDAWPRYYFDLDRGQAELMAYLERKQIDTAGATWEERGSTHEEDIEAIRLVAPALADLLTGRAGQHQRVMGGRSRWLYEPVAYGQRVVAAASIDSPRGCLACNDAEVRPFLVYLGIDPDRFVSVTTQNDRDVLPCPTCGASWMLSLEGPSAPPAASEPEGSEGDDSTDPMWIVPHDE